MVQMSPIGEAAARPQPHPNSYEGAEVSRSRRRSAKANSGGKMRDALDDYYALKELDAANGDEVKLREQPALVSRYYDVVTQFYEYAWGQSFHFSSRRVGENLAASQKRQEEAVGELLQLERPHDL